jgi:flagellar basal body rod protein FlgG
LAEVEDYYFTPTPLSGPPVEGSGEVRSGLLEQSNSSLRSNLNYIQFTKLQFDIVNKLVGQNKQLLQESVRLLQ